MAQSSSAAMPICGKSPLSSHSGISSGAAASSLASMSSIEIEPLAAPPDASVRPPGSKSLTNRALVCAALAHGTSSLSGVLDSEDTRVMLDALQALGLSLRADHATHSVEVTGCGGQIPATSAELYIAN